MNCKEYERRWNEYIERELFEKNSAFVVNKIILTTEECFYYNRK